ncbi:MAG: galactose-1-phosphate uridylyltransferase [Candidatus Doudnabacteria bacterium CG10_big_fil_rev_8_21_14_0_10_42_18]|uniref:Galactose-1-phosphate uridylyltransferase n=1 Tax=Candidatus Doudnabacteria bacterium CG10_big_fil_rev_8_21_14_0_10_42_18 TaxID=1974552 RepID=A0A2H0VBH2_9BACT|nr:MAG: galactose-1-phosphate uridylyltransferase [Candidatus Doudnabacteria bacterium CG10_big_fil_rev_8_21_14_0_10_42_18]
MSEFRQNPINKSWVLIAPNRAKKPEDYKTYSVMHGVPELEKRCVFCPGNEHLNKEVWRTPETGEWEIRVIENKFAALENVHVYRHKDFYVSLTGDGSHEVIIARKHNEPVALQSISTVELSIKTFIERINGFAKDPEVAYVQVFHNHGRDAGASLIHPHYQLLAIPIVPPHLHTEIMGCYHYHQNNKTCVYCDIIKEELKVKDRLVHESEHFVVISAYASRSPFETWILPKRHSARFEDMTEDEITHLAFVLKVTLGQLYTKLSDPPLNFYIHNMPFERDKRHNKREEDAYHWHLTIFPRITIWAGFEFASGIPLNPMPPEETAKFLRGE